MRRINLEKHLQKVYAPSDVVVDRTMSRIRATSLKTGIHPILRYSMYGSIVLLAFIGGFLFRNITLSPQPSPFKTVKFDFYSPQAKEVSVSGDFTGWERVEMKKVNGSGNWQVFIKIRKNGRYKYIFIIDQKKMISDPKSPVKVNDGFGCQNSILTI